MDTRTFFRHVLPATGPYCIARLITKEDGSRTYYHYAANNYDEAVVIVRREESRDANRDIFFAVGALIQGPVWDASKKRAPVRRDAANIRGFRSYFIDIDVGSGKQYLTLAEAVLALRTFVKTTQLPTPTIVCSGTGLHVYFTTVEEVPTATWRGYALLLKRIAQAEGLRFDPARTADCASVLRVVGTYNYKNNEARPVEVLKEGTTVPADELHQLLARRVGGADLIGPAPEFGVSNVDVRERTELSFPRMLEVCPQFAEVALPENQTQGAAKIPEPLWMHAVQLCVFMRKGREAAHRISQYDPRYNPAYVDQKFDYLISKNVGPTKCATFEQFNLGAGRPSPCVTCKSYGKITSPAQIARHYDSAPPLIVTETVDGITVEREVEIPPLPKDYVRTANGIGVNTANAKTGANDIYIFCPYDMYPTRLRYNERTMLEDDVEWAIKLPKEGWVNIRIPQGTPQHQLKSVLAKRGIYVNGPDTPLMDNFMTAYMRKLQAELSREKAITKYGWRADGSFALGGTIYKPDGSKEVHSVAHELVTATRNGICEKGSLAMWQQGVEIYNRPGEEGQRTYLYSSFGSPLFMFSGQMATFVSATGITGAGKSTLLEACASIWGDPLRLLIRGTAQGSTRTAAEILTDGLNNLPLFMDEISDRDPKDLAQFILNYSGGLGKIRGKAAGGLREDTASWANLAMANGNTNEYERMVEVNREGHQHLVRLVQLSFESTDVVTKDEGDAARAIFWENYGTPGKIFAEYIAPRQKEIKKKMARYVKEIGSAIQASSAERYWVAWAACVWLGAEIAIELGLLPNFPIKNDMQWVLDQLRRLRLEIRGHISDATELLSEFLEHMVSNTLSLSVNSNNINNIVNAPHGELLVRHEVDTQILMFSNSAFRSYCHQHGVNFSRVMLDLRKKKVLIAEETLRTLGANTPYSKGQVRCTVVNLKALGSQIQLVPPAMQAIGTGLQP
jgi:hypothetical protein